jgi:hypothetical protein
MTERELTRLIAEMADHVGLLPLEEAEMERNLCKLDGRVFRHLSHVLKGMWDEIPDD